MSTTTTQRGSSTRLSVVVATRNRAAAAAGLVEHLRSMPDPPDEIVVVDDDSEDDTLRQLDALRPPPVVVRGEGRGPARARNLGARAATGDWLVFLDDDDDTDPSWASCLRGLIEGHPSAQFVSTAFRRSGDDAAELHRADSDGRPAFSGVRANFIAGTFAVRADLFGRLGGFDDELRCMEFTDLAMRTFRSVAADDLAVATSDAAPITVNVRAPQDRPSQDPEVMTRAWERVFDRNREAFSQDAAFHADQLATLGVAWIRGGDPACGRRFLLRAARTHPTWRHATRALVSAVPPLRRRLWRS